MKSLLTDEIIVFIAKTSVGGWFGVAGYYWTVVNAPDFGIDELVGKNFDTKKEAASDFVRLARKNGWENYKFPLNCSPHKKGNYE